MAQPATLPLRISKFPSEKSIIDSEKTRLGNIEEVTAELMHQHNAVEDDLLGALQNILDEAKNTQQFPHRIEAVPTADPSSSVP
jgi:hypothetical protein